MTSASEEHLRGLKRPSNEDLDQVARGAMDLLPSDGPVVAAELLAYRERYGDILARNQPPAIVFHYCPGEAFENIVRSGELWLGDSRFTNDKEENLYAQGIVHHVLKRDLSADIAGDCIQVFDDLRLDPHIGCFSGDGDSLSQWRLYARSATGFAIGFASDQMSPLGPPDVVVEPATGGHGTVVRIMPCLMEVIYEAPVQETLVALLCKEFLDATCGNSQWNEVHARENIKFVGRLLSATYCIKHPGFHEEREWRLLLEEGLRVDASGGSSLTVAQTRFVRGVTRSSRVWSADAGLPIAEVRLGPQNSSSVEDVRAFLGDHGLGVVPVIRSVVPYRG